MTIKIYNEDDIDKNSIKQKLITIHPIVPNLIEQLEVYFMIILYGGRDSGKTVAMIHLLLLLCLCGNNKIAVFRAEQHQLNRESIMAMITNVIYKLGLHPFCRRIGNRILINNKIEISINGFKSYIVFDFVGNNPEKLRGSYDGFNVILFEELHQFAKRVLDVALPTIERSPIKPHVLGTCNLEDQNTYAYDLLKMGGLEREEQGWQDMIKDLYGGDSTQATYPHFGLGVEMLYKTNPYLTKFALNRIIGMKHGNYQEYLVIYENHPRTLKEEIIVKDWKLLKNPIEIVFDHSGDTWIPEQDILIVEPQMNNTLSPIIRTVRIEENFKSDAKYGQDYGTNDYFVNVELFYFSVLEWDEINQEQSEKYYIYFHRIVMERNLDNMDIIPRILQRMPEQIKYQKLTYGDCARKDMINSISNGFKSRFPKMNVIGCFKYTDQNSNRDSKGAILDGIGFIKGATILVNPQCQYNVNDNEYHCKDVIFQLQNYRWFKDKKTEKISDNPVDADNDLFDATRYALEQEIQEQYGITEYSEDFWDVQREGIQNASYF